ncbi:hypothetical protein Trco_003554 [Trichoderma cornu-damae]|uniref:Uncharacterized protein n=1 Tax=Trichoderma cornu-damae TaxID=654480 RepID=A0A9P8QIX7_9HYPO|nr:hypothetical protein Trco_003554 [Trichoderma cornu-damae]
MDEDQPRWLLETAPIHFPQTELMQRSSGILSATRTAVLSLAGGSGKILGALHDFHRRRFSASSAAASASSAARLSAAAAAAAASFLPRARSLSMANDRSYAESCWSRRLRATSCAALSARILLRSEPYLSMAACSSDT